MQWVPRVLRNLGLEALATVCYGATVSGMLAGLWGYILELPVYLWVTGGVFIASSFLVFVTYVPWWWRNRQDLRFEFSETEDESFDPNQNGGHQVRFYRVGVRNKSHKDIAECQTELSDIFDNDGYRPLQVPKFLEYQLQPGQAGQKPLRISSTRRINANLVSLDESYMKNQIMLRCASPMMPIFVPRDKSYFLLVSTFAVGGIGSNQWFHVFIDEEGRLRCRTTREPRRIRR